MPDFSDNMYKMTRGLKQSEPLHLKNFFFSKYENVKFLNNIEIELNHSKLTCNSNRYNFLLFVIREKHH